MMERTARMNINIIDIHSHILPYVDDGAYDMAESLELLNIMRSQGVRVVCATPHLREGMFDTENEEVKAKWRDLKKAAEERGIRLTVSREYHFDSRFKRLLTEKKVIPYGKGKVVLTEFSRGHELSEITDAVNFTLKCGFRPLIAHVERYTCVREETGAAEELINMGALLQVNTSSILGHEGRSQKSFVKELIKNHLVTAVASDAHDVSNRPPEWDKATKTLRKWTDEKYIQNICGIGPRRILEGEL